MNIAICEYIESEQTELRDKLIKTDLLANPEFTFFDSGIRIIDEYKGGKRYDMVFLDIDLPDLNGIDVGKAIDLLAPQTIIIFFTHNEKYALDAFDCNAFHYLLKSTSDEKFYSVIFKATEKYKSCRQYITIKTKDSTCTLNIKDIYYVESVQKKLHFHTFDGHYITSQKLYEIHDILSLYGFYQVHQGYIVNFDKVRHISRDGITLDNGKTVAVSVRKYTETLKAYAVHVKKYSHK